MAAQVKTIELGVHKSPTGDEGTDGGHGGGVTLPGWMYDDHFAAALDGRTGLIDPFELDDVARKLWDALHPIGFRFVTLVYASGRRRTYRETKEN